MIQVILVGCAIGLALFYLSKKGFERFSQKNQGCDGCAMGKSINEDQQSILNQ